MTWQEAVATAVLLAGLFAGAFLWARRPSFWIEFFTRVAVAVWPSLWRYISKRMPPEQEAEFQKSVRQAREWDPFRKRARDK